jgi:hypothetical protein
MFFLSRAGAVAVERIHASVQRDTKCKVKCKEKVFNEKSTTACSEFENLILYAKFNFNK